MNYYLNTEYTSWGLNNANLETAHLTSSNPPTLRTPPSCLSLLCIYFSQPVHSQPLCSLFFSIDLITLSLLVYRFVSFELSSCAYPSPRLCCYPGDPVGRGEGGVQQPGGDVDHRHCRQSRHEPPEDAALGPADREAAGPGQQARLVAQCGHRRRRRRAPSPGNEES